MAYAYSNESLKYSQPEQSGIAPIGEYRNKKTAKYPNAIG